MTRVINMKSAPKAWLDSPHYAYVGRSGKGLDGPFGNPFPPGPGRNRQQSIALFEEYLKERIEKDEEFRKKVAGLKGKVLVCFCKPLACHGDVLARYAEQLG